MMRFLHSLSFRKMEVGVACLLLLLMTPIVWESIRLGAGFGGHVAGSPVVGPRPGFFPLMMAGLVTLGVLGVLAQALRDRRSSAPFLEERQGVVDLLQVGIPVVVAAALVPFLGLYIVSAVYIIGFALWYGRVRWYVAAPIGLALPVTVWWGLEVTFRLIMPKSPWYPSIPF
jgi:putative tricarboxylic transport membrane protein